MKRRIALVTMQVPVLFFAGAVWADQLDNTIVLVLAVALVATVWFTFYHWALSLADWQYQAGRVDGVQDARAVFGEHTEAGNGA